MGKEKAARHQLRRAGSRAPLPNVWVSRYRLETKFKETAAREQAQKRDAVLRVLGSA